jgi:hypothetical protein
MLTYVTRFVSGDLEPFWPHVSLLSLSVLASIAVGAGIIFERPKYSPVIHRVAFWLVVGGVVIEAVCTIFLFVFDEGISEAQQSKIIALETRLTPRHFSDVQKATLANRMKKFPDTKFAMSAAGGAEAENFAIEVADALTTAGWQWINWPLGGIAVNPPGGRPQIGLDLMAGTETHIFHQAQAPIATELFRVLSAAGFKNQWVLLSPANPNVADVVIIIIGSKE